MIYPGIQVSVDSLTANASQLSGISLEAPKQIIGKNYGRLYEERRDLQ